MLKYLNTPKIEDGAERMIGDKSLSFGSSECFLEVEKSGRIRANVVYERVGKEIVGVYSGYCGGQVQSDGFFHIGKHCQVSSDETELPSKHLKKFYELQKIRSIFSDWEKNDDGSEVSDIIPKTKRSFSKDRSWTWQSDKFDKDVLAQLSSNWNLIISYE